MEKSLCWQLLSEQERASCIGQARSLSCCPQNVWDVAGPLQADWNSRVQPQIHSLIIQNYKKVFGTNGVHAALAFHLFLLSPSQDPSTARPTVVILTADKKTASRAKKLLLRHEIFKSLNTGFDIYFENKQIFFRADDPDGMNGSLWTLDSASLCGAPAVVAPSTPASNSRLRSATVFCCVCIEGQQFAVLPAHVFYPEVEDENPDIDLLNETDSRLSDSGESDSSQSEVCIDSGFYSSSFTPHQENWRLDVASNHEIPLRHDVYIIAQSRPVLLGHLDPARELPSGKPVIAVCRDVDFALVAVENPDLILPNQIDVPGKGTLVPHRWASEASDSPVLILSSASGSRVVKMSGTDVTMIFPWSSRPQRVWQLMYALPPGDSGSLVVSPDGEFIGMAVASNPEINLTYVMPAIDIFEIIWHFAEDAVSPTTMNDQPLPYQSLLKLPGTNDVLLEQSVRHDNEAKKDNGGKKFVFDDIKNADVVETGLDTAGGPSVPQTSFSDQWLQDEDEALTRLARCHGAGSWLAISKKIPPKSPKQRNERLEPRRGTSLKVDRICAEDEKAVERLASEMDDRYTKIARRLAKCPTTAVSRWYSNQTQQPQVVLRTVPPATTRTSYRCTGRNCSNSDLTWAAEDTFRAHVSLTHPWEDQDTVVRNSSYKTTGAEPDDLLREFGLKKIESRSSQLDESNVSWFTKQQQPRLQHEHDTCWVCDQYGYHFNILKDIPKPSYPAKHSKVRSPFQSSVLQSAVSDHYQANSPISNHKLPSQNDYSLQELPLASPPRSPLLLSEDDGACYPVSTHGVRSYSRLAVPLLETSSSRASIDSGYFSIRESTNSSYEIFATDKYS